MKILKRCFLIEIILIILFLVLNANFKETVATTDEDKILVTGTVLDDGNNPVQGVTVTYKNINGSTYNFETTEKGEYYGSVEEGQYTVEYTTTNYTTQLTRLTQYDRIEYDLELAFIYPPDFDERIKLFNKKMVEDTYNGTFRRIGNSYSNDIMKKIEDLERQTNNDNAFHLIPGTGKNKAIAIVITDENTTEIAELMNYKFHVDCYQKIIPTNSTVRNIIDLIYGNEVLKISKRKENEIIPNSTTNISIDSTTIVDFVVKQTAPTTPTNTLPLSGNGFIKGRITKPGGVVEGVAVTLIKNDGKKATNKTNELGIYDFGYPGPGTFKLEFNFEDAEGINAQYYRASSPVDYIEQKTNEPEAIYQNCMKLTNDSEVKAKELEHRMIDYSQETVLDGYVNTSNLKGISEQFTIKNSRYRKGKCIWNSQQHRIQANVKLEERPKFCLTVNEDVNRYKIVLSNGQVFKQYRFASDPANQYYRDLRLFNITMNSDISYGAKLYVEYIVTVKNISDIMCEGYTLLSRFENLEFDENQYLLENTKEKNKKYKWQKVDKIDIKPPLIQYQDNTPTMTYLKLESNKHLSKNEVEVFYVTLTRPLDTDDGSAIFNGSSEIIGYKNAEGRRNYSKPDLTGNIIENLAKSGNYYIDINGIHFNDKEADIAFSENMAILPPTGFDLKTFCFLLMSTIVCLIGSKYIIGNKLYINIKRNKLKRKWNKF